MLTVPKHTILMPYLFTDIRDANANDSDDVARLYESLGLDMGREGPDVANEYYGSTWKQALEKFAHGTPQGATEYDRRARELLDRLNTRLPLPSPIAYERAISGDEVDVPAFLAGEENDMIKYNAEEEMRHFPIAVNCSFNCDVDGNLIANRGAVVQALVEYLAQDQRNHVELYLYIYTSVSTKSSGKARYKVEAGDKTLTVFEIGTKPLDRDLLRYCVSDRAFFRRNFADLWQQETRAALGPCRSIDLSAEDTKGVIMFGDLTDDTPKFKTPAAALKTMEEIAEKQIAPIMAGKGLIP